MIIRTNIEIKDSLEREINKPKIEIYDETFIIIIVLVSS